MKWKRKIISGLAVMLSVIMLSSNMVYATDVTNNTIAQESVSENIITDDNVLEGD